MVGVFVVVGVCAAGSKYFVEFIRFADRETPNSKIWMKFEGMAHE